MSRDQSGRRSRPIIPSPKADLDSIVAFIRDRQQKPAVRASSKVYDFVNQCVGDRDFKHPQSEALLHFLLIVRDHLLDGFNEDWTLADIFEPIEKEVKRYKAQQAVLKKLEDDPKQYAKEQVHSDWLAWQAGEKAYRSQADFAREMLKKWEGTLVSQPTIESWCRSWKKSHE